MSENNFLQTRSWRKDWFVTEKLQTLNRLKEKKVDKTDSREGKLGKARKLLILVRAWTLHVHFWGSCKGQGRNLENSETAEWRLKIPREVRREKVKENQGSGKSEKGLKKVTRLAWYREKRREKWKRKFTERYRNIRNKNLAMVPELLQF